MSETVVHAWRLRLDEPALDKTACARLLDIGERRRAIAFRSDAARARFVLRRAFLRSVLARAAGVHRASIRIRRPHGDKPRLVGHRGVEFSTSHRDSVAVVAVTAGRPLGVDVELPVSTGQLPELDRTSLSRGEARHLASLPSDDRPRAFARLWSRKEAWVKMTGTGFAVEPRSVNALTDETLSACGAPCRAQDFEWRDDDAVGALVVSGTAGFRVVWHDARSYLPAALVAVPR